MDFKLSGEEEVFRRSVHDFFQRRLAPEWVSIDEKGFIPLNIIKDMARLNILGMLIAPEYGGAGASAVTSAIAVEESGYADPSLATSVYLLVNNAWPYMLQLHGTEEVKRTVLPRVTGGDAFFGIASTEAQGGSDISGLRTVKATLRGDGKWVLDGEKAMVSGVTDVERLPWGGGWLLITRSGPLERKHKTLTAFALLARRNGEKAEGYSSSVIEEIGRHGIKTGSIHLKDLVVDDRYRIGEVNQGFKIAMQGFNLARCLIGAACIGAARWALDRALEWLKAREIGDRPLASRQGVNFRFAELHAELEAAKLLCYRAAWLADRHYVQKDPTVSVTDLAVASACAKMKAPEVAVQVFQEVMKWHGGMAFFKETRLHRGLLGVLAYLVGAEGAQNIMRYIVARNLIGSEYVTF